MSRITRHLRYRSKLSVSVTNSIYYCMVLLWQVISVHLSTCVAVLWSHTLESFQNNSTADQLRVFAFCRVQTPTSWICSKVNSPINEQLTSIAFALLCYVTFTSAFMQ